VPAPSYDSSRPDILAKKTPLVQQESAYPAASHRICAPSRTRRPQSLGKSCHSIPIELEARGLVQSSFSEMFATESGGELGLYDATIPEKLLFIITSGWQPSVRSLHSPR